MSAVLSSPSKPRRPHPATPHRTIRECRLIAVPEDAPERIAPDSTLERGGRTYQVTRREAAGEVGYAYLRLGEELPT